MPGVIDGINNTTRAVQGLGGNVAQLGSVIQVVGEQAGATLNAIDQRVSQSLDAFARMTSLMGSGPGTGGQAAFEQTQMAGLDQLLTDLQGLETRPGEQFGVSLVIENELERVRAGEQTVAEAIRELMRLLAPLYGVIQREYGMDTRAEVREIGQRLQQFINTGQAPVPGGGLPGGADGGLTPGPRETPATAGAGRTTTAGIGGGIADAVRESVAALGATVTQHNEQQAERVLAGVQQQGTETRAVADRNQRVIAEWQRTVEGSYFRPLRENMFSPRELSDAFQAALASRRV